ncbi:GNAT family N-acetyltransferase [Streptomyces netropsis]|uniref:RimJ/RimL family protein N-acetyltransferase n=1 Tax=Streptomyces netropsis TaxID=55404 RepID=A0A7W7LH78_STRNE|nr:GNAT family N-acetyltransferase [Streptomyces netropsis]MBB4890160.1 RimJ/RimL family protein N-acetyltransferase [Streptomyces netropsis]GGR43803.1 alanine acetyltransferase [Streptomyces netropsis]
MSFSFSPTGTDLITERLVLTQWSTDELSAVLDERRLARWAEDFPAEGDRAIAGFMAEQPECMREAYGQRQIVERETGLVVGAIGLFWPPADRSIEIGYGIVPSRRGRGYAAEATRALAGFVLAAPGVDTVYANVELSNPASGRVLEKAGLRRVGSDAETVRYVGTAADLTLS